MMGWADGVTPQPDPLQPPAAFGRLRDGQYGLICDCGASWWAETEVGVQCTRCSRGILRRDFLGGDMYRLADSGDGVTVYLTPRGREP